MIFEVSKRYARALFYYAQDSKNVEAVSAQLNQIAGAIDSDVKIREFILSPIVTGQEKMTVLKSSFGVEVSKEVLNLAGLLIEKNRIDLFSQVAQAFSLITDEAKGVTRGTVKSAVPLNEDSRRKIEATTSQITNKKVILNYVEDKSIVGGLVAQVGGWTFDDSLKSHLTRLSEDLNRRV